ncbi:M42 family metallopeptidase [Erysipelothrix rhusiopathiae]|nr:M42 family metallopeptidase [Erysipelothrix rhusiopathiae]
MLNEKQLNWFETLTQLDGVSGHEHQVAQYLFNEYSNYTDEILRDNLGSILAVRRSNKKNAPKVLVLGHMDEVGFLVREVTETGVLKIHPVGGWFSQVLLGHRVRVTTRHGEVYDGAIGATPPHMLSAEERLKPIQIPQMTVDVGATTPEEVHAMGIQIGDMVVVDGEFNVLNKGKRLLAKAFDNRYGCVVGLDLLEALKDQELDYDLYVGCSVQEEVGLRGAQTVANLVKPDLAIILDCSPANDALDSKAIGKLGGGVLVRVMDGNMIATKDLIYKFVDICNEHDIKHQYYFSPGGTDAGAVHKSNSGVKTLTCCLCARNIHTSSSILDTDDYLAAREALLHFIDKKTWGDVIA